MTVDKRNPRSAAWNEPSMLSTAVAASSIVLASSNLGLIAFAERQDKRRTLLNSELTSRESNSMKSTSIGESLLAMI